MPRLEHDLLVYALWIGPDPNEWKQQLLKDGFRNWFGYDNPEVAELFAEAVLSPDRDVRKVSYFKIQEIVNRDMPRINLFEAPYAFAHTTAYSGFFSQEGTISYRMDLTKVRQEG
jgi:ABC-type transport system substrate-binding protein